MKIKSIYKRHYEMLSFPVGVNEDKCWRRTLFLASVLNFCPWEIFFKWILLGKNQCVGVQFLANELTWKKYIDSFTFFLMEMLIFLIVSQTDTFSTSAYNSSENSYKDWWTFWIFNWISIISLDSIQLHEAKEFKHT